MILRGLRQNCARLSHYLAKEGNAMYNAISAALACHTALVVDHHQKLEMSGNAASENARVTSALLRCLKTSTLSDDDDDINDTPEEVARHELIR